MPHRCIVIGASAGGLEPLKEMVSRFPSDLPAPVFVVMHVPAYLPSYLPEILRKVGRLPAIHPEDNRRTEVGFIYVAPPDHHLLVDDGYMAVKRGPKENGFRPSIDALFRSAAYSYGPAAIGVVLSGALNDGTSGLWSIKRLGGIAIVQDPFQAAFPSMPRSALEFIEADYRLPAAEIGDLLVQLAREQVTHGVTLGEDIEENLQRMAKELHIAAGINVSEQSILDLGPLTPFTCPECKGSLVKIKEGNMSRFRCHTGHGFTADALLEAATKMVGEQIWQVTRGLQEAEMLLNHMGQHLQEGGRQAEAEKYFAKARELSVRASHYQNDALFHETLSSEKLDQQEPIDEPQESGTDD
ncbi:MAG TPA: chemotaxis protein CheB [Anaerolineales bacterium]|nr:chemotaxis protein CheB [Anaerolineales bacterium]